MHWIEKNSIVIKIRFTSDSLSSSFAKSKINYNAVDLVKFIMSMLVVSIHINPFNSYGNPISYWTQNYIARLAVPFFFICTGYFVFRNHDDGKIYSYLLHIIKLYIVWTIIYLPLIYVKKIEKYSGGIEDAIEKEVGDLVFKGSYIQLWYLPAVVYAVFIIHLLIKWNIRTRTILCVSAFTYTLGLMYQSYYGIFKKAPLLDIPAVHSWTKILLKTIDTTRNGIFFGMFFVTIGLIFANINIIMSAKKAAIGFILSMFMGYWEIYFLKYFDIIRAHDMYIFLIPASLFLFYLTAHIELKNSPIFKKCRQIGMLVFCDHLLIDFIIKNILNLLKGNELGNVLFNFYGNSLVRYVIVIMCSILTADLIIKLSKKKKFEFLRVLL